MLEQKIAAIKEVLKDSYGYYNQFYDISDAFVVESLKENIRELSQEGFDPFEKPDNKAATLSAFYRVLDFYTTADQYNKFVMEMYQSETAD